MIYYCVYKDKCSFKECIYQKTKSKFSKRHCEKKKDLTIDGFNCIMIHKKMRLISDERIICNKYQECIINCPFKTIYVTVNNFTKYLGYKFRPQIPFKCRDTGQTITLLPAGKNVENHIGSYISIWNQPNLFIKKIAREE